MKSLACLGLSLWGLGVLGHEGHGLADPHWHSTDVIGFVVLGLVIVLAYWANRRK